MKLSMIYKTIGIALFILSFLGSFTAADKISQKTLIVQEYDFIDDLTETVRDQTTYTTVLATTWISGGIICKFLYGIGEILDRADKTEYKVELLTEIINNISNDTNKIDKAI